MLVSHPSGLVVDPLLTGICKNQGGLCEEGGYMLEEQLRAFFRDSSVYFVQTVILPKRYHSRGSSFKISHQTDQNWLRYEFSSVFGVEVRSASL